MDRLAEHLVLVRSEVTKRSREVALLGPPQNKGTSDLAILHRNHTKREPPEAEGKDWTKDRLDFCWRPDLPSRHKSFPTDLLSQRALELTWTCFFPQSPVQAATLDEVLTPNHRYSMVNSNSAGYYYSVLHCDKYDPAIKSNPEIIEDVRGHCQRFRDYVMNQCDSLEGIRSYIESNEDLFAARLA